MEKEPIYVVVRGNMVVAGPYKYKWEAVGARWDDEEVVEVLPTDQGYEELKSCI